MRCKNCKNKLPDKHTVICPDCGQKSGAKPKKKFKALKIIGGILADFICFACLSAGFEIGGAEGISYFSLVVTAISLAVCIYGIVKKSKFKIIIPIVATVIYYVIRYCAINGRPYFIRQIPGEDFLSWLFWVSIGIFAVLG